MLSRWLRRPFETDEVAGDGLAVARALGSTPRALSVSSCWVSTGRLYTHLVWCRARAKELAVQVGVRTHSPHADHGIALRIARTSSITRPMILSGLPF